MRSINDHIEASGLSRQEICRRAKLSPSMLSMIASGERRVGPERVEALAVALGVEPAALRPDLARLFRERSA
jgi:transcriptional regulator with XRE-family HTH domain